jgi:hypothetical protein
LAKNRFRVTFSDIDVMAKAKGVVIDWKRVRDEEDDYQPLLDNKIVLDYKDIYDKAVGVKLDKSAIECLRNSIGVSGEEIKREFVGRQE